jgi:hypothetical protein
MNDEVRSINSLLSFLERLSKAAEPNLSHMDLRNMETLFDQITDYAIDNTSKVFAEFRSNFQENKNV